MITTSSIPSAELKSHPLSYADPGGRLFIWRNELYRGITHAKTAFFEKLLASGVLHDLVRKGLLVETERADVSIDGFGLVLKHRRLPFVSYQFEWGPEMLRDAALLILELAIELARHKLTLQDAHGWNIIWDGCQPKFVDFGSIVPAVGAGWAAEKEFHSFFLYPLHFMAAGYGHLARWLLHNDHGVQRKEYALMRGSRMLSTVSGAIDGTKRIAVNSLPEPLKLTLRRLRRSRMTRQTLHQPSLETKFRRLYDEVVAIRLPKQVTEWSGYYDSEFPPLTPDVSWTLKHRTVYNILRMRRPATVLDIGSNRGWFSLLAVGDGAHVVAFDTDEACVDRLYLDAKRDSLQIQPLVMSFTKPSPGYGINNNFAAPATERLRCDFVLGLALVHHLVFKDHLNFQQIASGFAAFSTRALLVEFVPREDRFVRKWMKNRHDWYGVENFIEALKRHFNQITVQPSAPSPRVLLLCER